MGGGGIFEEKSEGWGGVAYSPPGADSAPAPSPGLGRGGAGGGGGGVAGRLELRAPAAAAAVYGGGGAGGGRGRGRSPVCPVPYAGARKARAHSQIASAGLGLARRRWGETAWGEGGAWSVGPAAGFSRAARAVWWGAWVGVRPLILSFSSFLSTRGGPLPGVSEERPEWEAEGQWEGSRRGGEAPDPDPPPSDSPWAASATSKSVAGSHLLSPGCGADLGRAGCVQLSQVTPVRLLGLLRSPRRPPLSQLGSGDELSRRLCGVRIEVLLSLCHADECALPQARGFPGFSFHQRLHLSVIKTGKMKGETETLFYIYVTHTNRSQRHNGHQPGHLIFGSWRGQKGSFAFHSGR